MEEELFLSIKDYIELNRNKLLEGLKAYYNFKSYKINYQELLEFFPELLFAFYQFILKNNYAKSLKERLDGKNNESLVEALVYMYLHAAIPVTIAFTKGQKDFFRKFLIPVRYSLSDIMYYGLSTLRTDAIEDLYIESGAYAFVSYRYYEDIEYTFLASDYQAYAIYELNEPKMIFGDVEEWEFEIGVSYLRLLDDTKAKEYGILTEAKGFGIFLGNKEAVENTIFNPMYAKVDQIEENKLGIDFTKVDFDLLKEEAKESFELIRYHYEANQVKE